MAEDIALSDGVVKDTDIVFDCPYCSKSLAIDFRGAGLTIQCSDCGADVQVPIPDGMELADLDNSSEELESQLVNLRRALAQAQHRIRMLEDEVDELSARRAHLERNRTTGIVLKEELQRKTVRVEELLEQALEQIRGVAAMSRAEHIG
jgi:transcription elongation factor Elf1